MSKIEVILNYLKQGNSISDAKAVELCNSYRLSAIIYNLRHNYNLDIESEMFEFTDRFGNKSNYAKYIFKGKKDKDNKDE